MSQLYIPPVIVDVCLDNALALGAPTSNILLSDGLSCRCIAREKPNKLLASPVFLITLVVSRLKAEISVHPKKLRSGKVKVL